MIPTIYLSTILLILSLEEIWCNQHVTIDQNYSDQLNNHINHKSSQQLSHNEAYHPSTKAEANSQQFKTLATDPLVLLRDKTTSNNVNSF